MDRLTSDYFQVSGRTSRGKVMLRSDWFESDHFRSLPRILVSLSLGCLKFESFFRILFIFWVGLGEFFVSG